MADEAIETGHRRAWTAAVRSARVVLVAVALLVGSGDAAHAVDPATAGSGAGESPCEEAAEALPMSEGGGTCPAPSAEPQPDAPAAPSVPEGADEESPTSEGIPTPSAEADKGTEPDPASPAASEPTVDSAQQPTSAPSPTSAPALHVGRPGNHRSTAEPQRSHQARDERRPGQADEENDEAHEDGAQQGGESGQNGPHEQGENGGHEGAQGTGGGGAWVGPGGRGGRGHGHDRDRSDTDRDAASGQSGLAGAAGFAGFGSGVPYPISGQSPIPPFLVPIYQACGSRYDIPWHVLAAINKVETGFGSNLNVSSAGAAGWMQFLPSTWSAYGVDANGDGRRDPYDPKDAVCAAANYLDASGGRADLRRAIFAYNHAGWYVDMVLSYAREFAGMELDPLPRQRRLDPAFARMLERISHRHDADWALVLAVLRARGERGRSPATKDAVRTIAARLAGSELEGPPGSARRARSAKVAPFVRALFGQRPRLEHKVEVLARYHRAIGLRGLVKGIYAVSGRLERRVLSSERLSIYEGGRADIRGGRIDGRVLALLLYLGERHDDVTVTSLVSGHGYYARPGVPSAHVFGQAVDIAAIGGVPVLGNQTTRGVVERAVRDILLLPRGLQPAQLISLFELGGPSFAAADHADHLHVGY